MNQCEFEQFLHEKIPITKAMGLSVIEFTTSKVRMYANLEANINDKLTAFGGSINSLMTICGWAMVFINIKEIDVDAKIVIKKSNINYLAPIKENFIAECELSNEETKKDFLEMYAKHNKSRLNLKVSIKNEKTVFAEYEGQYVVFK
jgi:thioesterase domain-containing protein